MGPTSTSTITCRSRKTRWRRARCTTISNRANSRARRAPASTTSTRTSTEISTAALINWLCMGVGALVWGALSDRFGTRAVVLSGGVLLGLGLVTASQAASLGQFQLVFGMIVGLAAGSFYTPMTATTTRGFTRHRSLAVALVSAGLSVGSAIIGPLTRLLLHTFDWRFTMLAVRYILWALTIPPSFLSWVSPRLTTPAARGEGG